MAVAGAKAEQIGDKRSGRDHHHLPRSRASATLSGEASTAVTDAAERRAVVSKDLGRRRGSSTSPPGANPFMPASRRSSAPGAWTALLRHPGGLGAGVRQLFGQQGRELVISIIAIIPIEVPARRERSSRRHLRLKGSDRGPARRISLRVLKPNPPPALTGSGLGPMEGRIRSPAFAVGGCTRSSTSVARRSLPAGARAAPEAALPRSQGNLRRPGRPESSTGFFFPISNSEEMRSRGVSASGASRDRTGDLLLGKQIGLSTRVS